MLRRLIYPQVNLVPRPAAIKMPWCEGGGGGDCWICLGIQGYSIGVEKPFHCWQLINLELKLTVAYSLSEAKAPVRYWCAGAVWGELQLLCKWKKSTQGFDGLFIVFQSEDLIIITLFILNFTEYRDVLWCIYSDFMIQLRSLQSSKCMISHGPIIAWCHLIWCHFAGSQVFRSVTVKPPTSQKRHIAERGSRPLLGAPQFSEDLDIESFATYANKIDDWDNSDNELPFVLMPWRFFSQVLMILL